ncbi:MazG-like family protein [Candidatus Pelagibacter bacterium]|nr:MazG-like family protein [Candidatus Pelagibacter bacterium]MDA8834679.1 MazG-like family protein [Candidatus Pelagibacter bacterium]
MSDELIRLISLWSMERGIINNSTPLAQFAKLVSEVGELGDNVAKERDVTDDIGDCLVVLNNLAIMNDTTLEECLKVAYNDIKDRKGHMNTHGVFIKEGDAA